MSSTARLARLALFNGSVAATGNILSQYLVSRSEKQEATAEAMPKGGIRALIPSYDPMQTARFFLFGMSFAPISYRWHSFLNRRFPLGSLGAAAAQKPASAKSVAPLSSKLGTVAKRVAVDQTMFAPFACGYFVTGMAFLEGLSPSDVLERAKTQYLGILVAGYALWPAAQIINFSIVPLAYRVQFGSVVSLFWNTYLGWNNNQTAVNAKNRGTPTAGEAGSLLAAST
ncbi:hypothetical protein GGI12_000859 [Dipsacomyces acuminosporus]|nr:hypothetical protein GGI12_000859 [Dipsacomyces acuminosporus]